MPAFTTLLIANRGEIACRIIRTAKAMGLRTVAVYSDVDARALHVSKADDAVRIGPGPVGESYLSIGAILNAAQSSGANAIHPGYGFLSENAEFAQAVVAAGLVFVGPPAEAIAVMGDKARAKVEMLEAGVPCLPGYQGADQGDTVLIAEAQKIGLPVMIKASSGGGGRGMRLVEDAKGLPAAIKQARSEAESSFGSGDLIVERAVEAPRHVEIQIFADNHGACMHLGERDCSVQRRHQKVVEEAPCPALTPELRERMGAAAVKAAQAVGYVGAGTVEFLLDEAGNFYFLEMNTRLQVEHPVTEIITGLDLVELQLAVAQGEPLPLGQTDVVLDGHAIEARLYAEEPAREFLPASGQMLLWEPPEDVRVDAGIASCQDVSPFYDPMLAKIIAHGPNREVARKRLIAALEQTAALGVATNRLFLIDILKQDAFADGAATTDFVSEHWPDGVPEIALVSADTAVAAALVLEREMHAFFATAGMEVDALAGFASDDAMATILDLEIDGRVETLKARRTASGWRVHGADWSHSVEVKEQTDSKVRLLCDERRLDLAFAFDRDDRLWVSHAKGAFTAARHQIWGLSAAESDDSHVLAPMHGRIVSVDVSFGERVVKGQTLIVLEAMKMQHLLVAQMDADVLELQASEGAQVSAGDLLVKLGES